jgi:hypothetical protein
MAKKPLPAMIASNTGINPPFVPLVMKTTVGPQPPKGIYQEAGLFAKLYDYVYNGQGQTSHINQTFPFRPAL